jgi:hypothetical protein
VRKSISVIQYFGWSVIHLGARRQKKPGKGTKPECLLESADTWNGYRPNPELDEHESARRAGHQPEALLLTN